MIIFFLLSYSVLFDFTKDEDAGNADWVVDRNMPVPYPSDPEKESDWDGALSAWGVHLRKEGWDVKILPPGSRITYGTYSTTDLKYFDLFVIPEPQLQLSYDEIESVYNFVRDGGGLIMIANHSGSDRNHSNMDSPMVFNLMGIKDSFGLYFSSYGDNYNNITKVSGYIPDHTHPMIDNMGGRIQEISFHGGTTIKYYQYLNPEAKPVILYKNGYAMVAVSKFGKGKVIAIGDSSPADDGTGDPHDRLYNGWGEVSDSILFINASYYAVQNNGIERRTKRRRETELNKIYRVFDITGRFMGTIKYKDITLLHSGIYILKDRENHFYKKVVILK